MGLFKELVRQAMAWDLSTKDIKMRIMSVFSVDEKTAERVLISAKSERSKSALVSAKKRMVFLPQCIRAQGCKAPLGENGFECRQCNSKCQVFIVKKMVDKSVPVYVMPGGTIVFKVISREKPDAVFGIACFHELELAYQVCEKAGVPAVSVPLLRDGCVNTLVDIEETSKALSDAGLCQNSAAIKTK